MSEGKVRLVHAIGPEVELDFADLEQVGKAIYDFSRACLEYWQSEREFEGLYQSGLHDERAEELEIMIDRVLEICEDPAIEPTEAVSRIQYILEGA